MTTATWAILGCILVTAAIKGAGALLLGDRALAPAFSRVVVLLAPALLAGLVVTSVFADGSRLAVGPETAGVGAGALVLWRGGSVILVVLSAAAVTALLRAAT